MGVSATIDHCWDDDGRLRGIEVSVDVDEDATHEQCALAAVTARQLSLAYIPDLDALCAPSVPDHLPDGLT